MKKLCFLSLISIFAVLMVLPSQAAEQYGDTYGPSSALVLGEEGSEYGGSEGFVIAVPFQLNLLYQEAFLDEDIDAFNTYNPPPYDWTANFSDNEEYVFAFDAAGDMMVYTWPDLQNNFDPDIQWRLTGWHQTILAGDIVNLGDAVLFRVIPNSTYRPFPNDPPVNDVEVFDGRVACEIFGYIFYGPLSDVGEGSVLGVAPKLADKQDCMKGGWKDWGFKNQGQCVELYNAQ